MSVSCHKRATRGDPSFFFAEFAAPAGCAVDDEAAVAVMAVHRAAELAGAGRLDIYI